MDRSRRDTPSRDAGASEARTAVALLDAGGGRRLERLGTYLVDRPAPMASEPPRLPAARWLDADLRFDAGAGWTAPAAAAELPVAWQVEVGGLAMELRPTASGGVGLYPEHAANLAWLERAVRAAERPAVLNLFAHTGLATLAAARAGAAVVHVDGARGAIAWARRNAELNRLADRPIRWIVEDALAFVAREARRGHRYDGLIVDPPSFGRSGHDRWRLHDDLEELLISLASVTSPGAFALVTAHTAGLDPVSLVGAVRGTIGRAAAGRIQDRALELRASSGARLPLGWAVTVGP